MLGVALTWAAFCGPMLPGTCGIRKLGTFNNCSWGCPGFPWFGGKAVKGEGGPMGSFWTPC